MKVRIDDREALEALSWKSLKAYLDRADGWQYAEDIPGKAAVYQHADTGGRLREILVPLRRDIADYVSRMADAVSTLAHVEDRSELDIYVDLRAPAASDAAQAAHERIRKWLTEEGWHIEDIADPQASFNVMVTLQGGPNVNIFQYLDHLDHVTVSQHWLYDEEFRSAISQLPDELLRDTVWAIYRDVSMMGVEFLGLDTPSKEMTLRAYVYFDGLTKDVLIQRILLTIRTLALAIRTFVRALEGQGRTAERVVSADGESSVKRAPTADVTSSTEGRIFSREELVTIMRRVPSTGGPLMVAG